MAIQRNISALLLLSLLLASCHADQSESSFSAPDRSTLQADAPAPDAGALAAGEVGLTDAGRKMMREAALRCRVADVLGATVALERSVTRAGGIVAESLTENVIAETRTLPYSADSLKQIQRYITTARLRLRIPVAQLDTVLAELRGMADFTDSRNLRLDDATLQYLGNKWKADALAGNTADDRALALSKKTGDAVAAGDYGENKAQAIIDKKIENLGIDERVRFATLSLDLYQPERLDVLLVANSENIMQPSFGRRISDALAGGADLLKMLFVGLLHIWPLLLAGLGILLILRRRRPRRLSAGG